MPQKNLIGMDLNNEMQSVTPSTPSYLSRNNSDTNSTTSSFQTRKQIIDPCSRKKLKSVREKVQQRNNATTTNKNLKK